MKKIKKNLLIICLLVAFCMSIKINIASASSDVVVSVQIDNPIMKLNGVDAEIDAERQRRMKENK